MLIKKVVFLLLLLWKWSYGAVDASSVVVHCATGLSLVCDLTSKICDLHSFTLRLQGFLSSSFLASASAAGWSPKGPKPNAGVVPVACEGGFPLPLPDWSGSLTTTGSLSRVSGCTSADLRTSRLKSDLERSREICEASSRPRSIGDQPPMEPATIPAMAAPAKATLDPERERLRRRRDSGVGGAGE